MALVERLMNLADDGVSPAPDGTVDPTRDRIKVHLFFAAQSEIVRGAITVAQVKSYLQMNVEAQAEYDALIALAPTGTNATALALKALFVEQMHAVFLLAEKRVPGYSTPAEVRTKLGL